MEDVLDMTGLGQNGDDSILSVASVESMSIVGLWLQVLEIEAFRGLAISKRWNQRRASPRADPNLDHR